MARKKDKGTTETPPRDASVAEGTAEREAAEAGEAPSTASGPTSSGSVTLPAFGLAEDILAALPHDVGAVGAEPEPPLPADERLDDVPPRTSPADEAGARQPQTVAPTRTEPAAIEEAGRGPNAGPRLHGDLLASAVGGEDDDELDDAVDYDTSDSGDSHARGGRDDSEYDEQERDRLLQLVTFFLDQEEYGIPIARVQEINRVVEVTRVPNSPEHVMGVMNLRGKIVPVIELKRRLCLGDTQLDRDARIVVVERGLKILGLMVDRVAQVLQIPASSIDRTPDEAVRSHENFTLGVGRIDDRMVIVLDVDKVVEGAQQGSPVGHA